MHALARAERATREPAKRLRDAVLSIDRRRFASEFISAAECIALTRAERAAHATASFVEFNAGVTHHAARAPDCRAG